jgi:hypothetical protein
MTNKIYKTAQGKAVDLGTIMLQNEHVRAVGNMNVNARGDKLDQNNRVIETKARQIQKQNERTTNVSSAPVQHSSKARKVKKDATLEDTTAVEDVEPAPVEEPVLEGVMATEPAPIDEPVDVAPEEIVSAPAPVVEDPIVNIEPRRPGKILEGGVAAAIARQREANQAQAPAPTTKSTEGGLAGAIARQREVKQELEKTRRQQAQAKGLRKI